MSALLQLERDLGSADEDTCAQCGTHRVTKIDAIGRTRARCPKCDGVSPTRPRHPDEALVPQTLVRARRLPTILTGQLRCQTCASGVHGAARFCADCLAERARDPKRIPCVECATPFVASDAHPTHCRLCAPAVRMARAVAHAKGKPRPCDRCQQPIHSTGGRLPKTCEACLTPRERAHRESQRRWAKKAAEKKDGGHVTAEPTSTEATHA